MHSLKWLESLRPCRQ